MNTPVVDFIKKYQASDTTRMHMPGHKGAAFLGFEGMDITEIKGADSLYHADGIILESEANASGLFGTKCTLYSAEGSSHVIKSMLALALLDWKKTAAADERPVVVAGRNAHVAFVHAVALLDMDVEWLYGQDISICACSIDEASLTDKLDMIKNPVAVYITSPDYLGGTTDIRNIADICERKGVKLLVDNAHGAYLKFLDKEKYPEYVHPMEAGAYMCSDSAHKTLPVLTGGAYLHMSEKCNDEIVNSARNTMAIFGSTSPSYLIMASLDNCNKYIVEGYKNRLNDYCNEVKKAKAALIANGWKVCKSDPLKITIEAPGEPGGEELSDRLRDNGIEAEYADNHYVVLMLTPESGSEALDKLVKGLGINDKKYPERAVNEVHRPVQAMTIRQAVLGSTVLLSGEAVVGKVCAAPKVICPPAIPLFVPGEIIDIPVEDGILCVSE